MLFEAEIIGFFFYALFSIGIALEEREPISPEFPDQLIPVASDLKGLIPRNSSVLDCSGLDLAVVGQPYWSIKIKDPSECNTSAMDQSDWLIAKKVPMGSNWVLLQNWSDIGGQINLYRRSKF